MNKRARKHAAELADPPEQKRARLLKHLAHPGSEFERALDFFFGTHAKAEVDVAALDAVGRARHYPRALANHTAFQVTPSAAVCELLSPGVLT